MQRENENLDSLFDKLFDYMQENKIVSPFKIFTNNDKASSINLENLIIALKKIKIDQKIFTSSLDTIIKKFKTTIKGDLINLESLLADFKTFSDNKNKEIKLKKLKEKQKLVDTPSASPNSSPRKTVRWKDEEVKVFNIDEEIRKRDEDINSKTIESNKELGNSLQNQFLYKEFDLLGSTVLSPLEKIVLVEKKIQQDLMENNNYKLLKLYEYFNFFTEKFGSILEQAFIVKNPQLDGYLKKIEFDNIFRSLNIFLTDESKLLIFNDIPSKENSRYSFKAFLEKVYNFKKESLENQIRSFNHSYNEYIVLLRKHVRDHSRKIDIPLIVKSNFQSEEININEFFKLMWMIGFIISEKENEYMFNILSERGNSIKLTTLMNILYLDPFDLQVMKNSLNKTRNLEKLRAWRERIIKFDYERAFDYKKHYGFLENIFKNIQNNLYIRNIQDICDIFSNMEINEQGECEETTFINVLSKFNLQHDKDFVNMLEYFINKKNYKFDLCAMINAFNAVLFDNRKINEKDQENNINLFNSNTNIFTDTKHPYHPHRKEISSEEVENLRETCNFIIEIINNEKFMTYSEFFKKADKKNTGYFTTQQFISIIGELDIETTGDSAESLNVYFNLNRYFSTM
jgi:Ca2+-binding EF-hand superfamily protein